MNKIQLADWKYEIQTNKLENLITGALKETLDEKPVNDSNSDPGRDHFSLSQNWVKNFALRLETSYSDKKNIKAFYRDVNIKEKEFLYDITVGKCEKFSTKHSKKELTYVSKSIWQIESEFRKDATEIAYDFSKLFSGNAPFKMMVGPLREKEDDKGSKYFMDEMKKMCNDIPNNESWYFLLITHPRTWFDENGERTKNAGQWVLYKWNGDDWDEIG